MYSGLDFAASSEPIVRFAFLSGLGATVLILLLIAYITWLRVSYRRKERRKRKFLAAWRDLLNESALPSLDSRHLPVTWRLPAIAERDAVFFLSYWSHLQSSVRGEARARLNILGQTTGMDEAARNMLRNGSRAEKLLAIVSLGYFGEESDAASLEAFLDSDQPVACLHAAHALLCIEPQMIGKLLPVIVRRNDLPTSAIASLLKAAGADAVSPVLAVMLRDAFMQEAAPGQLIRLISLTIAAHPQVVHFSLRMILDKTENPDVMAACLKVMRSPSDLHKIRQFATHPNWRVRVQAASALGDIGEAEDMDVLKAMLSDSQWWVRYRAAQAISRLPFVTIEEMNILKEGLTDGFAVDMLEQVMSEHAS